MLVFLKARSLASLRSLTSEHAGHEVLNFVRLQKPVPVGVVDREGRDELVLRAAVAQDAKPAR